ncbi:MAG: V-type ATP synthase subunit E [Trueperaceae bacterium]
MADLSTLLEKEASTEIEAILSEARERASDILAGARSEADALVSARERAAKAQREAALVRARSSAQLEASSLRLNAQHDGVQSVFEVVRSKLDALLGDAGAYAPVFAKLLSQALEGVGGQEIEAVQVAAGDREMAEKAARDAGVSAPVETADDIRGGVRLRTRGRSIIENTLFGRLEALQGELASEVSQALFQTEAS